MLDNEQHEGLTEWLASTETGKSSKAIVAHLAGVGEQTGSYPIDGSDFIRCEHLLDSVPSLKPYLYRMKEVNAYWEALLPKWHDISASADKTAEIKRIITPIQKADPSHAQITATAHMRVGPNTYKPDANSTPMKETDADREVRDGAYRVAGDEIRSFVERAERLDAEKKDVADQQKEVFAEAKSRGYCVKTLKKIIAERKKDADARSEEQAVFEMYAQALGM